MSEPSALPSPVESELFYKALIVILDVAAIIGFGLAPSVQGVAVCLFIAILTLGLESSLVAVVANRWQHDVTSIEFFQYFGGAMVTWNQIEIIVSVFLATINFWSFVLLTRLSMIGLIAGYFFLPGVATALIIALLITDAITTRKLSTQLDADDYTQI
uniref:DUF2975 domain-containing protein n=1 Tax=Panagrellus redivivus TaxID=6233 RepID=A0A7E4ULK9_PANRE